MRPSLKGSRILVTGGAGFIGSHTTETLLSLGAERVIVLDNLFLGRRENLSAALARPNCQLHVDSAENIAVVEALVLREKIDIVFNCATKALNHSFIDPPDAFHVNTLIMSCLLECLRKSQIKTLCHLSSSEVYGTAQRIPMDETHPCEPTTTYAAGKLAADVLLRSYVRMFGVDAFIVRPFNNFGPRQNYRGKLAGVIPRTICAIAEGRAPEIHGSGEQTRDFIFVKDTVASLVALYPCMKSGDVVNIASGRPLTIRTLVEAIAKEMAYAGEIRFSGARAADVDHHTGSSQKLESLIDVKQVPFDQALRETIRWYLAEAIKMPVREVA